MLNPLKTVIVSLLIVLLVGCETIPQQETKVVYITSVEYVIPSEVLLTKSPEVPAPPELSKDYAKLTARDREAVLTTYIRDLFSTVIGPMLLSNKALLAWRQEKEKEAEQAKTKESKR